MANPLATSESYAFTRCMPKGPHSKEHAGKVRRNAHITVPNHWMGGPPMRFLITNWTGPVELLVDGQSQQRYSIANA